ncbi:hypothetical protein ACFCYM_35350 [Streptomyces sp. NPDC056254]|uniref:hypothetical protein n=1 Tax=Streptomyces sp. NPDC056254 TaxID=3345763 RepID=UPI0035DBE7A5
MTRSARRAATGAPLLLLAALLLSAVTMLSPGRPSDSHAMEDVYAHRCVASAGAPGAPVRGGAHHTPASPPQLRGPAREPAPEPAPGGAPAAPSGTGTGAGCGRAAVCATAAAGDLLGRPAVLRIEAGPVSPQPLPVRLRASRLSGVG